MTLLDMFGDAPEPRNPAAPAEEVPGGTTSSSDKKSPKHSSKPPKSPRPTRKRSKVDTAILVTGEILVTLGIIVALFFVWKYVVVDWFTGQSQSQAAEQFIQKIAPEQVPAAEDTLKYDPQSPVVTAQPGNGEPFGILYIPRLDPNYKRVIGEGTGTNVLDDPAAGIAHYTDTAMPGGVGNFSLAGHRNTVFSNLKSIVPGDFIYVQTADGYYTYQMQEEHDIVLPTEVSVIAPVPDRPEIPAEQAVDRWLTLTTCWPEWSNTERLIVHAKFVEWRPLAAGPPAEIAAAASN